MRDDLDTLDVLRIHVFIPAQYCVFIPAQYCGSPRDARQRVTDLVGQARRYLTDSREPLDALHALEIRLNFFVCRAELFGILLRLALLPALSFKYDPEQR